MLPFVSDHLASCFAGRMHSLPSFSSRVWVAADMTGHCFSLCGSRDLCCLMVNYTWQDVFLSCFLSLISCITRPPSSVYVCVYAFTCHTRLHEWVSQLYLVSSIDAYSVTPLGDVRWTTTFHCLSVWIVVDSMFPRAHDDKSRLKSTLTRSQCTCTHTQ